MNEKEGRTIQERNAAEQTAKAIIIFPAAARFEYSIESAGLGEKRRGGGGGGWIFHRVIPLVCTQFYGIISCKSTEYWIL